MMEAILSKYYADLTVLGEGAMGKVWRATDSLLERDVAIKVMKPEIAAQADFSERFLVEARVLARISHPNIVAVYQAKRDASHIWIELEYLHGSLLDKIIATDGPMPWQTATRLIIQALHGLERAHAAGIIHRDVKPSNAIVTEDGTLKLMDFGIARVKQATKLTRTGYTLGTVAYMAPEQFQSPDTIDGRADLYSVGIMFYELLSGSVPFDGKTEFEILDQHVRVKPPPLKNLPSPVPDSIQRAIERALEKNPDKRFPDAASFRAALETTLAQNDQKQPREGKGVDRRLWVVAGALVVGVLSAWLFTRSPDSITVNPPITTGQDVPQPATTTPPSDEERDESTRLANEAELAEEAERQEKKKRIESDRKRDEDERIAREVERIEKERAVREAAAAKLEKERLATEAAAAKLEEEKKRAEKEAARRKHAAKCSQFRNNIASLERAGDIGGAIKQTGAAVDAGCEPSFFIQKRNTLVAKVRRDQ